MGDLKPLPEGAQDLESISAFLKICQDKAPPGSASIDPKNVTVQNRDEKVQLFYNDPSKSFYCSSQIDFHNHEMRVDFRLPNQSKQKPDTIEMTDACKVAKGLNVESDLPKQECIDGVLDDRLVGADQFVSFQDFQSTCKQAMSEYGLARKVEMKKAFSGKRVRLENPFVGDGAYNFLYESLGNNFFCDAMVDSNQHMMAFRSGPLWEKKTALPHKVLPMTDGCSMTESLLGKDELVGECNDMKTSERNWGNILGIGFTGVMSVLFYRWLWKSGVKVWGSRPLLALRGSTVLQGLGRAIPSGYLTGKLFDAGVGLFIEDPNHPVREYGKWGAGLLGVGAHIYLSRAATQAATSSSVGLVARLVTKPLAQRAGGYVTRIGKGALLVGILDISLDSILFKDYEKDVNQRVADRVYKEHVYKLDGWDLLVLPLALKGIRAGARFLAPGMMNWAISEANANQEIKKKILEEDRAETEKNLMAMQSMFATLRKQPEQEREAFKKQIIKTLQSPAPDLQEQDEEIMKALAEAKNSEGTVDEAKVEAVKNQYGLSDLTLMQAEERYAANKLQGAARFMVAVDQEYPTNLWARDVFTEEGLLKADQEQRFLDKVAPGL